MQKYEYINNALNLSTLTGHHCTNECAAVNLCCTEMYTNYYLNFGVNYVLLHSAHSAVQPTADQS